MSLKLNVIVCSTRPGRVGISIGRWFEGFAKAHGGFDVALEDLAAFELPVFDEPHHPRLRKYEHAHTKAWSASVERADAFVFVTPEYNFGPPPSLVNAMNYLVQEWRDKVAGFVSYGGVSGGIRAVQAEKLMMTSFKIMPLPEQVMIPNFAQHLDAEKQFTPNDLHTASATAMLDELVRWAGALKTMRGG
ncbi:NADPH-dependent FMN reductase [Phenylobacterium koreense]|uniref:NAD(P)H-dependent FMN reductase n=1 Tax=Phenylobacterium koreense TaxID=266125 RepID=A0ABV2EKN3_9CAUL